MIEPWLAVALTAALLATAYSILQKRLTFEYDGLELSYITSTLGLAFLVPVGAWYLVVADVTLTPAVLAAIVVSGVVNIGAIWAFLTALKIEDLSVVGPLVRSTPIAVALVEPLVLTADYEAGVVFGAVAAVVGAYVLLSDGGDLTAPIRRITDVPAVLALSAALLFATANIANRFVATQIPPLLYAFSIYLFMTVGFAGIRLANRQGVPLAALLRGRLVLLGGLTALRTSVTYFAFSLAIASRVSIVLQVSLLMDVVAGGLVFAERNVLRKLLGAACIVAGIVLTL